LYARVISVVALVATGVVLRSTVVLRRGIVAVVVVWLLLLDWLLLAAESPGGALVGLVAELTTTAGGEAAGRGNTRQF
jgi:hypothetical protein